MCVNNTMLAQQLTKIRSALGTRQGKTFYNCVRISFASAVGGTAPLPAPSSPSPRRQWRVGVSAPQRVLRSPSPAACSQWRAPGQPAARAQRMRQCISFCGLPPARPFVVRAVGRATLSTEGARVGRIAPCRGNKRTSMGKRDPLIDRAFQVTYASQFSAALISSSGGS